MSDMKELLNAIENVTNGIVKIAYDKKNPQQNYYFASWQNVMTKLEPLLQQNHLVILPEFLPEFCRMERIETKSGNVQSHFYGAMRFTIVHTLTGQNMSLTWMGESKDIADKAINQTATAAWKYFILKLFRIVTDDGKDDIRITDPDKRSPTGEVTEVTFKLIKKDNEGKVWVSTAPHRQWFNMPIDRLPNNVIIPQEPETVFAISFPTKLMRQTDGTFILAD